MKRTIHTEKSPKAVAAYVQGIEAGGFIYVSGQGPVDPKTEKIEVQDIGGQTQQTLENIRNILEAGNSSLEQIVKVNVYLRDMRDFEGMNVIFKEYFGKCPTTRTTLQVTAFPNDMKVEIDCVALAGKTSND